jgi:hypothetical protein
MKASSTVRPAAAGRRAAWVLAVPLLAAAAWLASPPAQAAGTVEVRFVEPENFTDAGHWQPDRDQNLRELEQFLQRLGTRLPDGQQLEVEVLDVDLAGEVWPRSAREVRILRGSIDWPAIRLRYTLREGGRVTASGEERITDMSYLVGQRPRSTLGELPYEKRMLENWFKQRFVLAPVDH